MKVIIMSGIPGCGKSTYAKENFPGAVVCSANHYFMKPGSYTFDPSKLGQAHGECLIKFNRYVISAEPAWDSPDFLVVDNTNLTALEIASYMALAAAYGLEVELITLFINVETAAARNVHGVSLSSIKHMANTLNDRTYPSFWKFSHTCRYYDSNNNLL